MYRLFEIIPGALAWLTLTLMVFLSWKLPAAVAVFIILFDIYWLLKTIYLSLHLRSTFSLMKANLKVDWLSRLQELPPTTHYPRFDRSERLTVEGLPTTYRDIYHLVVLPMYKEPYEVVRESFESLLRANFPKDKFIVVLAAEERGGAGAVAVGERIEREFGSKFFKFLFTVHPAGLAGEIPGKGANETWAAKEAKRLIIDPLIKRPEKSEFHPNDPNKKFNNSEHSDTFVASDRLGYENILVSVFDVDTQVFPEYFGRLTYVFLASENRERAIYQPIPLFTNNIYIAPALARVVSFSATFWQMMQQSRPERLTSFSSQSIPFGALCDIGFWQKDIVSEDSRIFWQCYLHYHGDFRVEPLLYPVSMDANAAPTFWATLKNIYRQQRRWGWGAENIPYLMCGRKRDPNLRMHPNDTNKTIRGIRINSDFSDRIIHPNAPKASTPQIVEKELSYKLTGIFFEVQKELGRYARERQYGDELALKLEKNGLKFKREQAVKVGGRKSNLVDFVVENRVAIEPKAKPFIQKEDYYQVQRYLQSSNLELGLIVNFAQPLLKPKRVLNSAMYSPKNDSGHSDKFVVSGRQEGFLYDKKIPLRKKWYWSFNVLEGFHSWATNSLIIFALGWLPVFLGGRHFNYTLLSYGLPQVTRFIVSLSMIGIASSAILGIILLPPRPKWFRFRHYLIYFFQWILMPVTLIVLGALPGLEAQTRLMLGGKFRLGFWVTPKHRI